MSLKFSEIKSFILGIKDKLAGNVNAYISKFKKPFIKYDFEVVESIHADEDSEPISQNATKVSFKIRLFDIIVALTFVFAIFSIFSKKDD